MDTRSVDTKDLFDQLNDEGYAVIEGVLSNAEVRRYLDVLEGLFEYEREHPFDPGDGPSLPGDDALEHFLRTSYTSSEAEFERLMRRIRYTRSQHENTPWPVPPEKASKLFLHLPTLFDEDRSQRINQLIAKAPQFGALAEHSSLLPLVQQVLGDECVLSDFSATSIGPQATDGGAWHVDVPLGQLPEPLPDFPLTLQNAWMLDDFTEENGATQVVSGSHLRRKKPKWGEETEDDVATLTGPAGSIGIWLSNTWHRSGPNSTTAPRRAALSYYCRSWVKPFSDNRGDIDSTTAQTLSPQLRYLLGYSATAPVRG